MRVLVVSDIHANLEALRSVVEGVKGWDEVVVLGNLVDYGPWPGETIDYIRSLGARAVRGNHDHAVAYGVDCRCGEDTHWLSTWFRENITMRLLSRNDKAWLAQLPEQLRLDLDGLEARAVHGAPAAPSTATSIPGLAARRYAPCSGAAPGWRPGLRAAAPRASTWSATHMYSSASPWTRLG
ncbi:metallophosphoesterase family protein [Pyrodictium occultum]|uniref:metallophosphoesterase family protein n=1 Tax=Pyrodictium occultum TaxID=2309 RepID=UPI0022A9DB8E|nr:metallophosphoesterase [Pyrodictium occultum]